jgi:hypothetical protein
MRCLQKQLAAGGIADAERFSGAIHDVQVAIRLCHRLLHAFHQFDGNGSSGGKYLSQIRNLLAALGAILHQVSDHRYLHERYRGPLVANDIQEAGR